MFARSMYKPNEYIQGLKFQTSITVAVMILVINKQQDKSPWGWKISVSSF
jgi:hypothetical protein